jgi:hypothetical protein
MTPTTQLGSFIVNLGHHSKIPRGEGRVFQIAGTPISVFHTPDGDVFATERTSKSGRAPKAYPATVDEVGNILVGIEEVLAAR